MPTRKASELEAGLVLIDPAGKLYEIISVHDDNTGFVHVWLWPDTSKEPDAFQTFERDEEIAFITQHVNGEAPTQVIPAVQSGASQIGVTEDVTDANGAAE